jgi:hypothetical protein
MDTTGTTWKVPRHRPRSQAARGNKWRRWTNQVTEQSNKLATLVSWLSLFSSLVICGLFLFGVVLNAQGNESRGNTLQYMAMFLAVAWIPLSIVAITLSWRSTIARLGCLLPFFVWGVTSLVLIYVFKQI